ncbi:MAG: imelysin family protein [Cellvibrionaceae bacterium]|nr:imelysin family protein [Cellvibrionaceae bacterium]
MTKRATKKLTLCLLALTALCLLGCEERTAAVLSSAPSEPSTQLDPELERQFRQAATASWLSARKQVGAAKLGLQGVLQHTKVFLSDDKPGPEPLIVLREQWTAAYLALQRAGWISFLPELYPELFPQQKSIWLAVDPWPIAPGYVDSFDLYPFAGIVHDENLKLDIDSLRDVHVLTDHSEAILGYLPLAYLLWGEDKTAAERSADFEKNKSLAHDRRRALLAIISGTLKQDSEILETWVLDTGRIDTAFYRLPPAAQLQLLKRATAEQIRRKLIPVIEAEEWLPGEIRAAYLSTHADGVLSQLQLLQQQGIVQSFDDAVLLELKDNSKEVLASLSEADQPDKGRAKQAALLRALNQLIKGLGIKQLERGL